VNSWLRPVRAPSGTAVLARALRSGLIVVVAAGLWAGCNEQTPYSDCDNTIHRVSSPDVGVLEVRMALPATGRMTMTLAINHDAPPGYAQFSNILAPGGDVFQFAPMPSGVHFVRDWRLRCLEGLVTFREPKSVAVK
jgi:hypothetical protein